jgi:hypothetical protein
MVRMQGGCKLDAVYRAAAAGLKPRPPWNQAEPLLIAAAAGLKPRPPRKHMEGGSLEPPPQRVVLLSERTPPLNAAIGPMKRAAI